MNLSFEQPLHYGRLHCQGNDFLFRNSQKSKLPDNNQFQPDMRNKTGTGTFKLDNLKRMTGTEGFEQLSENKKGCRVHKREECLTFEILKQVQNNCKCVPWAAHGCNKLEWVKKHLIKK